MLRRAEEAILIVAQAVVRGLLPLLLGGLGHAAADDEIAGFRLTEVEGYASMRYLDDRSTTRQDGPSGASRSGLAQSEWRNEVFLMTHSYVYHPNFLTLDVGGGPVLQLGELAFDNGAARSRGALYNLLGRATFLRGKPVGGALFYEHLNPVLSLTPGQILNQETSRYGVELSATAAAVPTPLRLEFTRSQSSGRSDERIMEDHLDQLNLRLTRSFGNLGATQVQFQASRQESMSGSTSLPIQTAASASQGLDFDTRLQFGAEGKHELINLVSVNTRRYIVGGEALPAMADLNLLLDLRLKHSDELSSFGTYHFSHNDNGERTAVTQTAAAGISWSPDKDLELSLGGRAEDNRAGPFSMSSRGLDGAIHHQLELSLGTLQTSYAVRYDQRGQRSRAADAKAVGERISLPGTNTSTLALPHVVGGSIVVSNLTRSQVYVENLDYTLSTVGQKTRLQRLIGGSILDGEEVLVDYAYDLGGTFAFAQTDQTLNLNWAPSRQTSIYWREYRSSAELVSGSPTFPLNDIRSRLYGMRADFPFRAGIAFAAGGSIEREKVMELISPLRRCSADLYLQTEEPLFDLANVGLSLRRMTLDYENSTQDMDLQGYGLRFSTQRFGADLSAIRNYECDRGAPVTRCRWNDAINAQWRERKLTMMARLARGRETQGGFERAHTLLQFTLRRDL